MSVRAGVTCLALAVAVAAGVSLASSPAWADHTDDERITDNTPYTLRPGEWRLGVWKLQRGLSGPGPLDDVEVGSYTVFWAPWAVGARLVNAHAKWEFWRRERFAMGLGLSLFYLDLRNLDAPVTMTIAPVDLYAGWRTRGRWEFSVRLTYTGLAIEGDYDEGEIDELRGAVAVSSTQILVSAIWRKSRRLALIGEYRGAGVLSGSFDSSAQIDAHTAVDVVGEGDVDLDATGSIAARAHWSWDAFNLRLGLTFGNYNIGGVNFVIPKRIIVPEFDVFWRF